MTSKIKYCFCLLFLMAPIFSSASDYLIGTYYFPGWTNHEKGLIYPIPWSPVKKYPDKEPLLGWYSDNDPAMLHQQVEWMREYGIGYVAFDWYWGGNQPFLSQAVDAFKASKVPGEMKYSILWANHFKFPGGVPEYKKMVEYWVKEYFKDPDFLKIDGRPAIFVFSVGRFFDTAKDLGVTPKNLIDMADEITQNAGLPKIYFVGEDHALEYWFNNVAKKAGFSSASVYNYRLGYSGSAESVTVNTGGWDALAAAYHQNWDWMIKHSALDNYIVPMSIGWDRRPWGGSKPAKLDDSIPTPQEFEAHLLEAKKLMDAYPVKTKKMGIICCWNEFGEGSYLEPTKKFGFSYLEQVKAVFGP
ncbi:glycoside hydrolase family 99-like domain-containing protein [Methylomonas sp. AM2-LC]|uniref:glycoside hydrolase family 99-like domain-containing protein n=1 Tax=Methylomonas sp. AM2-LC TaxID=3153301 RepID=UPI003264FC27